MSKSGDSIQRRNPHIYSSTAEAIAQHLTQFGQPEDKAMKYIGAGSKAVVFWLEDRKLIFKLTEDESDAVGMGYLQIKPLRGFIKVRNVFKAKQGGISFYGIVAEKLQELSASESKMWNTFFWVIDTTDLDGSKVSRLEATASLGDLLEDIGLNGKWIKLFYTAYKNPEFQARIEKKGVSVCTNSMRIWAKGFDSIGVTWVDLHDENILAQGREYLMMDLGHSDAAGRLQIPEIDV